MSSKYPSAGIMRTNNYDIGEHVHRFAAWAASTAARASTGCRFTVSAGTKIIEDSPLYEIVKDPSKLPPPEDFDVAHREWRNGIVKKTKLFGLTHGVAAKLINCYLKASLINHQSSVDKKIKAIHPPVDRILLEALIKNDNLQFGKVLGTGNKIPAWSKLDSNAYENIIEAIKDILNYNTKKPSKGLWEIEEWWELKK